MSEPEEKPICPKCDSSSVARISYGLPVFNEELKRRVKSKEIVLGGCVVSHDSPKYHCNECGESFGSRR